MVFIIKESITWNQKIMINWVPLTLGLHCDLDWKVKRYFRVHYQKLSAASALLSIMLFPGEDPGTVDWCYMSIVIFLKAVFAFESACFL